MFNDEVTVLSSAARTATPTIQPEANVGHRGMILVVNVTARAAATTLTPGLQLRDPVSGEYVTVWTAAAAINSGNTTATYLLYPSPNTDAASLYTEEVDMVVPTQWRTVMTHGDTDSITYSVAAMMML